MTSKFMLFLLHHTTELGELPIGTLVRSDFQQTSQLEAAWGKYTGNTSTGVWNQQSPSLLYSFLSTYSM